MKKYHIIFNPSIYLKMEDIFTHIAIESKQIATQIIDGIEKQIMSLELMPERFAIIPEKINYKNYQVRHFFYKKSFRIIYVICKNEVHILDVRHSARNYILEI